MLDRTHKYPRLFGLRSIVRILEFYTAGFGISYQPVNQSKLPLKSSKSIFPCGLILDYTITHSRHLDQNQQYLLCVSRLLRVTFIVFIHKTCLTIVQTICTQDGVQACAVKISSARIVTLATIFYQGCGQCCVSARAGAWANLARPLPW